MEVFKDRQPPRNIVPRYRIYDSKPGNSITLPGTVRRIQDTRTGAISSDVIASKPLAQLDTKPRLKKDRQSTKLGYNSEGQPMLTVTDGPKITANQEFAAGMAMGVMRRPDRNEIERRILIDGDRVIAENRGLSNSTIRMIDALVGNTYDSLNDALRPDITENLLSRRTNINRR